MAATAVKMIIHPRRDRKVLEAFSFIDFQHTGSIAPGAAIPFAWDNLLLEHKKLEISVQGHLFPKWFVFDKEGFMEANYWG